MVNPRMLESAGMVRSFFITLRSDFVQDCGLKAIDAD